MIVDREFGAGDSDEVPEDSTDIDKFSLSPRESNKPEAERRGAALDLLFPGRAWTEETHGT